MSHTRTVQIVSLALMVALLLGSAMLTPGIDQRRADMNLYGDASIYESAPPEYAFAIQAFGAFRSILTDIAFIRAEEFKRKGRYYDAMQLHEWICQLQPRFPSVWEYCSWNMAWNISVTTYTPEERWNWVYNGVKLIRDEGLKYNPRAVNLYKQIAWIFNNKMSEFVDEHHYTYKRYWAWRMHLLFGPPADPLGDYRPGGEVMSLENVLKDDALLEATKKARALQEARDETGGELIDVTVQADPNKIAGINYADPASLEAADERFKIVTDAAADRLRKIIDAPDTLAGLYAQSPETRQIVRDLRGLGAVIDDDRLTEEEYWRRDGREGLAGHFFLRWRRLTDPPSMLSSTNNKADEAEAALVRQFDEVVGVTRKSPASLALYHFLQKKVLKEVYKLDPQQMLMLTERFGPIDWRSVDAHSLYWTAMSILMGEETLNKFGNDKTNTSRILFFSLRNLYLRNKIIFEPFLPDINLSYFNFMPDLNFIESTHQAYITYGPLIDPGTTSTTGGLDTYRTGHINFLAEWIRMLWFAGRRAEAAKYYRWMQENYATNEFGEINYALQKPLADYVADTFIEIDNNNRETRNALFGQMVTAMRALARGDDATYNYIYRVLKRSHEKYNEQIVADKNRLPDFQYMVIDALRVIFGEPPMSFATTRDKVRLWARLPLSHRLMLYDDALPLFQKECELWDWDVAKAFPAPVGLEEFREAGGRRGERPDDSPVETTIQATED